MGSRMDLQTLLKTITTHVYFQPPETMKIQYPCVVYKRDGLKTLFANDKPYQHKTRYQIIVIDRDPDSDIPAKIAALPLCLFDRSYPSNNLNHDVYNLYF